jgi:hypothetical protein
MFIHEKCSTPPNDIYSSIPAEQSSHTGETPEGSFGPAFLQKILSLRSNLVALINETAIVEIPGDKEGVVPFILFLTATNRT